MTSQNIKTCYKVQYELKRLVVLEEFEKEFLIYTWTTRWYEIKQLTVEIKQSFVPRILSTPYSIPTYTPAIVLGSAFPVNHATNRTRAARHPINKFSHLTSSKFDCYLPQ